MSIRNLIGVCVLTLVVMTLAIGGALLAGASSQAGTVQSLVIVKPASSLSMMAMNPEPPASAQQKPSIGSGDTKLQTSDKPQDMDSYWSESIDIDGDGEVEETDVLWDDEDKVLFLYDRGPFMCRSGGQGNGDFLMAIYGNDNKSNRPAGSGWFIAHLDAGECGARAEGLIGCRFDENGKATECGTAKLDERNDEVIITQTKISGR